MIGTIQYKFVDWRERKPANDILADLRIAMQGIPGVSPSALGSVVQLVTTGLRLSDFRPAGSDDAVDIVLRLSPDQRTISALDQLRIETSQRSVSISNFVTRVAGPTSGTLTRIDASRTVTIQAGIREGVQAQPVRDGTRVKRVGILRRALRAIWPFGRGAKGQTAE